MSGFAGHFFILKIISNMIKLSSILSLNFNPSKPYQTFFLLKDNYIASPAARYIETPVRPASTSIVILSSLNSLN